MVGMYTVRQWLACAVDYLGRTGDCLLLFYESLAATSNGRLPYRPVSPVAVGSAAAVAGLGVLCGIVLVLASVLGRGSETPVPDGAGSTSTAPFTYIVRCRQCGWGAPAATAERARRVDRAGAHWCEKCRAYTADPQRVPIQMVVSLPGGGLTR